jgi:glycogen operon protein
LYPEHQLENLNQLLANAFKAWHGVKVGQPDWSRWSHSLAFGVEHPKGKVLFHVILNAYWPPLEFELSQPGSRGASPGRRWIDTALDSP